MGNIVTLCISFQHTPQPKIIRLVFWGGATQLLRESCPAAELLARHPDSIVCHADSFYVGRPVPALAIEDVLVAGNTYLVLPIDLFPPCRNLTTASLASLSSAKDKPPFSGPGELPFEYVKGSDGKLLIKVVPEFIIRVMSAAAAAAEDDKSGSTLCTTPELRKHYAQLVGTRDRPWSPKLDTISEKKKARRSPVAARLFDWR
ncbi:Uncharacterized protein M6B38_212780 [Iris pallida]|uniref:Uncharacterized protein n=1 Tax=Iris pallida TaxID=29817 RepID=A0AAX6E4Q9_IRIPA|nr:Uncharacterized protein M6B38_212780 [Iris pallida]